MVLRTVPGRVLGNFLEGVLSLRVPIKNVRGRGKMGVVEERWAWSIKFAVLYKMKLWSYGKA